MNILVIGSKGFIGSHVYSYFKNKNVCFGCDLIFDRFDQNYISITDFRIDLEDLFISHNFDVCINCSGSANVHDSLIHTVRDFELNVLNVILILDLIKKYQPNCKYINLSSAAVYGNPVILPIQSTSQLKPVSPYGIHKLMSEQLSLEYFTYFGIPTLSLRIFSAFGPGLKKQIFWDWFCKSQNQEIVSLYGNGNESRDYIYIDDLVTIIDLAINFSVFDGSCINVANGKEIFIKDIADVFFKKLHKEYFFNGNAKSVDPLNWRADIEVIKLWGYESHTSIEDGLIKYIEWAKGLN